MLGVQVNHLLMKYEFIRLDSTQSTNDVLRSHPYKDTDTATVAVADYQTAGRGQAGNKWESERGKNLLMSILTFPQNVAVADQYVLSMAGALALKATLDKFADGIALKWPNDIYWHDRKISGTLIETTVKGKLLERCIFGIGLNINQRSFHSDAPNPVSLYNIIGKETPLDDVLNIVTEKFDAYYDRAVSGDIDRLCYEYNAALYRRDGIYTYEDCRTGEIFRARIKRVDRNGLLHLTDTDATEREYWMKEVRFIV